MKVFMNLSGILKKTYDFRCTIAKLKSKSFLCKRTIKLGKSVIKRAICSPKYLVEGLVQGTEGLNLSSEFAKANNFKSNQYQVNEYYDSCGIYAYKNVVNGKEVVEMCLIKTFKDKNSTSISLYYLPNGDIRNAAFVARVCKHNNIEHINEDGTKIKAGDIHLHIATESQFDEIYKTYRCRGDKVLLEKLQSPRAVNHKGLKEEDMGEYARKLFHITDKTLESMSTVVQKDGYYLENGVVNKGVSNKTLVDEMGAAMDL